MSSFGAVRSGSEWYGSFRSGFKRQFGIYGGSIPLLPAKPVKVRFVLVSNGMAGKGFVWRGEVRYVVEWYGQTRHGMALTKSGFKRQFETCGGSIPLLPAKKLRKSLFATVRRDTVWDGEVWRDEA